MGKAKKGPKFAVMKKVVTSKAIKKSVFSSLYISLLKIVLHRIIHEHDNYKEEVLNPEKKNLLKEKLSRNIPSHSSALFFQYNTALGPPYRILVDTNFINFSIQNKEKKKSLEDYEKSQGFGIAKDPRFERILCTHKGTYADDCLVERVTQHKCYIVATCDRDLKRRIRKIPGVPIMYITKHKYSIERLPEATIGGVSLHWATKQE
ncbi:rRNA-processing protein FCF1 [Glycine max]|nr:rRNA-processing protein FCF1 [Glycine max]